jgi:hypothetical protein
LAVRCCPRGCGTGVACVCLCFGCFAFGHNRSNENGSGRRWTLDYGRLWSGFLYAITKLQAFRCWFCARDTGWRRRPNRLCLYGVMAEDAIRQPAAGTRGACYVSITSESRDRGPHDCLYRSQDLFSSKKAARFVAAMAMRHTRMDTSYCKKRVIWLDKTVTWERHVN